MTNKKENRLKKFFGIDFIFIEGLLAAGLTIIVGIIGVILYFIDSDWTKEHLIVSILIIIIGILIFIFRDKLRNFMT